MLDENGSMSQTWELGDQPMAVGRVASADVMIADDALSRVHFLITRQARGYLLTDLESSNGTWVDGRRTQTATLHHHDCILAGRTLFIFSEPP